jgi:hypothetical protein
MALRNRPWEEEFLYWAGCVTLRQKAAVSGGSDGRRSSTTQI